MILELSLQVGSEEFLAELYTRPVEAEHALREAKVLPV